MEIDVKCDLRKSFGVARDQLDRPTCMCFATSDVNAERHSPWEPLSCEYLYYHAIQTAGVKPGLATPAHFVLDALEREGQPSESDWPYLNALPADIDQWKPPTKPGPLRRGRSQTVTGSVNDIIGLLDRGIPTVLIMTLSDAFYLPSDDGIVDSDEKIDPTRVHAVVAAGHGAANGGKSVLIRNSWGSYWGNDGYAWVTERYLASRILKVVEISKRPL